LIFLAVSRFVDERTFDRAVDSAKMVKPTSSWRPERRRVYTPHRPTPAERRKQLKFVENGQA
jgi:hypothetical protein